MKHLQGGCFVSGFGFRVSGFGFQVSGFGFRVSGFKFRDSGFGFRVSGFRFRVSGFGFRVSGFRFRVPGFRFRVSGFRFEVSSFGFLRTCHVSWYWTYCSRRFIVSRVTLFCFRGLGCRITRRNFGDKLCTGVFGTGFTPTTKPPLTPPYPTEQYWLYRSRRFIVSRVMPFFPRGCMSFSIRAACSQTELLAHLNQSCLLTCVLSSDVFCRLSP